MDYTYDNYGLLEDCGTCLNGEFIKMDKLGINPCSIKALRLVMDSFKNTTFDQDKKYRLLCEYALAACYWTDGGKPDEVS